MKTEDSRKRIPERRSWRGTLTVPVAGVETDVTTRLRTKAELEQASG